ncbi:MAG: hypothetical protein KGQ70_04775, partial [Alphaproteobacteria bacterium]|nr:hypothetical protein [Alphaproteobacteria bacterium]
MTTTPEIRTMADGGWEAQAADCTHRIEELNKKVAGAIAALERGDETMAGVDPAAVTKEIALQYMRLGDLYLARPPEAASNKKSPTPPEKAAVCYEAALKFDPQLWGARMNLLKTKKTVTPDDTTKAFLLGMLAAQPDNVGFLNQLGRLHHKNYEISAALACFGRAAEIAPDNADSLYWLAGVQQQAGDAAAAAKSYRRAAQIRPVICLSAGKAEKPCAALLLFAPFAGNTPTEYLMADTPFALNIAPLFPDLAPDVAVLKGSGDVVVNFVSDADQGRAILPQAERLVAELGLPVVNPPEKIRRTTREGVAALLAGIPDLRMARIVRVAAGEPMPELPFEGPLLARPAGTHGGDRFEKFDRAADAEKFIREHPQDDHYLMEYVDYQSPDGHFRKYRLIFTGGKILPYHLAIGDGWKVHHVTTNMFRTPWMQEEEKAFLAAPEKVFAPKHFAALRAAGKALALDY